ncbi:MAG TPA: L-threonylcarbamoyladenylate synthase [Vicinamibacterales bacterium]|nr:L-threonylcarbamoyladenylate synthase [Vicinamibacterales bacterium]
MIRIVVHPRALSIDALAPAVRALRAGGVVAYPTETFYGLAADPRLGAAVHRIFDLKQRAPDQALPLIAADLDQIADHVGSMTPLAERLAARGWPGPLTLIIPASPVLCADVHLATGKVAVRVPADPVARALAAAAGHAITSTSANFSGQPPASTAEAVIATLGDGLDVVIDAGLTPGGLPSTIIDATGKVPVLVRAGAIAWDRVLEFLEN